MNRMVAIGLVLVLGVGGCTRSDQAVSPPPAGPHVVVIVLDTVRADGLGVEYGGQSLTPALDRIAAEGRRFDRAYSAAPWTVPSHASLFTGLYPHKHRAVHERTDLNAAATTMAEILARRGYVTGGATCNPWLRLGTGMAQGFESYFEPFRSEGQRDDKGAAQATAQVSKWLGDVAGQGKPVFLFVNYLEAHLPYEPPAAYLEKVGLGDADPARQRFTIQQAEEFIIGERAMSAGDWAWVRSLYDAEIAYLDDQVGRVRAALEQTGMWDDTLLIITSDHGEHLGENGLTGHEFTVFDAALHVPMLIRYPAKVFPGPAVEEIVSVVDVLPTVLDAIGAETAGTGLHGRSLLATIEETGEGADRSLLAEYARPVKLIHEYWRNRHGAADLSRFDVSLKAVRYGKYKYVLNGRGEAVMYDLEADPGETQDVSGAAVDEAAAMRKRLGDWLSGSGK